MRIASIVEGHGEEAAVRVLVRRIAAEFMVPVEVLRPLRQPKSKIVKAGELERLVELAARQSGSEGGILIVLDADTDCPAEFGPELVDRARTARSDREIRVVLAKSEFESWFLAAAESLAGRRQLATTLAPPADPEAIRDAKGWLSLHMRPRRPGGYRETLDQAAFAQLFDMDLARTRSGSFDKFWRDVSELLTGRPVTDA